MAEIKIENLKKTFRNGVEAVKDFSLEVADGEFIVIVGPSGCGKSTTLRMIAGLEEATSGRILLGGRDLTGVDTKDRDIAMVFQNYALYENMTVFGNIAFPLKVRKESKEEIEEKVAKIAQVLKIDSLLQRRPKTLSGGEKQRVAMGRALVRQPKLFLMDEPLSNLDARLRLELRDEIRRIQKKLGATTIYVTHDQLEAMTMADRVVVMNEGMIQQAASPEEIYQRPANPFVAKFFGSLPMNIWKTDRKIYGIRPEEVVFSQEFKEGWHEARVLEQHFSGNSWIAATEAGDERVLLCSDRRIESMTVWLCFPPESVHIWEDDL